MPRDRTPAYSGQRDVQAHVVAGCGLELPTLLTLVHRNEDGLLDDLSREQSRRVLIVTAEGVVQLVDQLLDVVGEIGRFSPDEKTRTAVGFLKRALAFYAAHGIAVERVMTDNGPAYASIAHAIACRTMKIRHLRTRPFRPRTNGRAERFIRTMLGGWAYGGSTETRRRGPQRYPAGWTSITGADRTALSATSRPGLALPS